MTESVIELDESHNFGESRLQWNKPLDSSIRVFHTYNKGEYIIRALLRHNLNGFLQTKITVMILVITRMEYKTYAFQFKYLKRLGTVICTYFSSERKCESLWSKKRAPVRLNELGDILPEEEISMIEKLRINR